MPYVQLDGLQYPLEPGDNPIGVGAEAHVSLKGVQQQGVFAILELGEDGTVIVRSTAAVPVLVNGLDILDQPSPLIHGDKLEVLGKALFFGDDRRIGSTAYVPRVAPRTLSEATLAELRPSPERARVPTASTGGRLVSLVDGREYPVPDSGLIIGRDPDCQVVIPSTEVSRRHATIAAVENGYLLTDASTNGVQVNGFPSARTQLLGKGDLIRIADEEFRFHADLATPVEGVYGTLEVRGTSTLSGTRFDIRSPAVRIGRGPHNDIVLPDDSVSDAHAMLQLRDEIGWCVVDLESTNGTYVSGKRVHGMSPLATQSDLRIAGIKLLFRSADAEQETGGKGTRVIAPAPRTGTPRHVRATEPGVRAQPAAPSSRGVPMIVWMLLMMLLAVVVFIFLTSN